MGRFLSIGNYLLTDIVTYLFTSLTFWLSSWLIVLDALITVRFRIHSWEGPRSKDISTYNVFLFHDVSSCVTYLTFLVAMVTNITKVTANKTGLVYFLYFLQYILPTITVQCIKSEWHHSSSLFWFTSKTIAIEIRPVNLIICFSV